MDGLVTFQPPPSEFRDAVTEATAFAGIAALTLELRLVASDTDSSDACKSTIGRG
jgi:hypothetical protein